MLLEDFTETVSEMDGFESLEVDYKVGQGWTIKINFSDENFEIPDAHVASRLARAMQSIKETRGLE